MIVEYLVDQSESDPNNAIIYQECAISIIAFGLLFLFSRSSLSFAIDVNVMSLSLTFSEGLAFATVVMLNISFCDTCFIILLLILGIFFGAWTDGVISKDGMLNGSKISYCIFFIANILLYLCRVVAALNFKNSKHVDIIQKGGAAVSLIWVLVMTVFDGFAEYIPFYNAAGGISDYTVNYIILSDFIKFKVVLIYKREKITVTASRKKGPTNEDTSLRAEQALFDSALNKDEHIRHFKNVINQEAIDRYLIVYSVQKDEYIKAILTCLSIGCFKAGSIFYKESISKYIERQDKIFSADKSTLHLEHIMLDSSECNFLTAFKNISIVTETSSLDSSLKDAAELRRMIVKKLNEAFVWRSSTHVKVFSTIYKCVQGVSKLRNGCSPYKVVINMKDDVKFSSHDYRFYGKYFHEVINPYYFGAEKWTLILLGCEYVATISDHFTERYSKITSISESLTVTNVLMLAKEAKKYGKRFTIESDLFETADSLTLSVARGVKADRIRIPIFEDTCSMIHEHIVNELL